MRVTKEPEERRQEILDTAMRLFYEKGYEKTSIADLAKAMNVAQGLCYRYFPSKEALLDAAVDQYAEKLAERLSGILHRPGLELAQVIAQMPSFLETEADGSFAYLLCHGPESLKIHNQLSLRVCEKLCPCVKALLDRAVAEGKLHLNDTGAAASFCVYGQLGLLLDTTLPGEERVRRIRTFLLELIQTF